MTVNGTSDKNESPPVGLGAQKNGMDEDEDERWCSEAPGSNVNRQRDEKRRVRFVDERDGKTEDAAPAVTTEAAYASTSDVVMANDGTDECETTDPAATTVGAEVSSMAPGEDTVHGDDGRGPWTAARWLLRCSAKKSSEW
ncbi:hypothetical protein PF005_g27863 [Phytophthora fragariae]|uniref:Uncharacterized protein n=1 Tax=Phytophthora fragariae TaxID=53985 RepID=A0A6A3DNA0_9STRA|nr:hypothetical protein PF003_g35439 [Phytophthora fragariae]KAE8921247.1 hypothetical protein PF009_g28467 [Phytophthora fragariae]KAE9067577.1 hypothetical protein PF010_g27405 [Phytophthora fragariae]KAE9169673.1 hypothetical protein PF005_g27863 [Phytophthora fragariae]KAE9173303.1 hypothetical protein PF004_g27014 [Phytophthora fragariae]